ncbi:thioredoxin-dependent thiol peroxidase [Wenxinia saemankumensis]|uniref:thioredoxin-dependent peroxiredoxin n=1 Tax=Wenxinia saemankumensis TaxID=1447782 RepID=A0A1M6GQH5_9RHOB|nr:thioredoxin-dependent thiol peroxidase [Wenxinia saemankumensis]SHJ12195.1 peroxiredoxin Q/BCP [Wenxinia saemankumensis]
MTEVTKGDTAPAFTLPAAGGGEVSLSDFAGSPVVLYFYPRDDTSGCTTEAKDFTTAAAEFEAAGAVVLGVSKDSVASHDRFAAKHDLNVRLLSDEESDVCERYGVWGEKKMYGKTFMGIERATFLVGPDGKVAEIWRKVKVPGHVDAVLDAVKSL